MAKRKTRAGQGEAKRSLKASRSKQPNIQQKLDTAVQLLEAGHLPLAEEPLSRILDVEPNHPEALHLLGFIALGNGKNDRATEFIAKALAVKPDYPEAHNNLGNAFRGLGQLDDAVACYQQAIAFKPDYVNAHNNLGVALQDLGRLEKAVASLHMALSINPDFTEAHFNLGNAFKELEWPEEAVDCYRKALAIKPDFAEAHYNLGLVLQDLWKLEEAVACYQKALALKPDYADVHNNLCFAFKELGWLDEAIDSYQNALSINPDNIDAKYNLGLFQLLMGDFPSGWGNWNCRWRLDSFASGFEKHKKYGKPLWRGEAVDGKPVLVWAEQGVGETILFASMIPDLIERGAEVILECDNRLIPLFSRSYTALTCVAMDETSKGKPADKEFDFHVPFGNLGYWLRPDLSSFGDRLPYLKADAGQRLALRKRYLGQGNDFLVGIAWSSKHPTYGERKSMTLQDLRPLLEIPGVTFIDLQYGETGEERKAFTAETGIEVFHDDAIDQMADLDAFASQVAAMDMVVTISNTTAHMAGALGVSTLLMLGTVPYWYWLLERQDNPWYPSLRLFRQLERGDWEGVVERVCKELAGRSAI